jgi:PAP2 superfamily/Vanadium chloroperoxidase N-terminal domain
MFSLQPTTRRTSRSNQRRRRQRQLHPTVERLEKLELMSADAVFRWNTVALDAVAADYSLTSAPEQAGPTATARALAIVQIAVFDAVNCIDHAAEPYLLRVKMPKSASVDAAVAKAAHDTLVALYPKQEATFNRDLADDLAAIPNGRSERLGIMSGRMAAQRILKARAHDGSDANPAYNQPVKPGTWESFPGEPTAVGTAWGMVKPFGMDETKDFLAPLPPALNSAMYAAAYDEVKALGGDGVTTPTIRTPEQTQIGIFWGYDGTPGLGTPPRLYNQIAQVVARQQGNTEVQNARMFALINIAMADAGIASWDAKYTYDFWRPVRAIRQVGPNGENLNDGNPATAADPTWTPLGAPATNEPGKTGFTPPFPAYVSGHATFGAAVFETLTKFYGADDIAFSFTSDEFNGVNKNPDGSVRPVVTRSFDSFSSAAYENAQSRIYLGIHWGFDRDQGLKVGSAVADYVYNHTLQAGR